MICRRLSHFMVLAMFDASVISDGGTRSVPGDQVPAGYRQASENSLSVHYGCAFLVQIRGPFYVSQDVLHEGPLVAVPAIGGIRMIEAQLEALSHQRMDWRGP